MMFSANTYQNRRKVLCEHLNEGLILLLGNNPVPMNYPSNCLRFRQDSNFLYYCGLDYPHLNLVIDVEGYNERRRESLVNLSKRVADRVIRTGRPIALEPMSPSERRIVHITLAESGRVTTESSGSGSDRRVVIHPN